MDRQSDRFRAHLADHVPVQLWAMHKTDSGWVQCYLNQRARDLRRVNDRGEWSAAYSHGDGDYVRAKFYDAAKTGTKYGGDGDLIRMHDPATGLVRRCTYVGHRVEVDGETYYIGATIDVDAVVAAVEYVTAERHSVLVYALAALCALLSVALVVAVVL